MYYKRQLPNFSIGLSWDFDQHMQLKKHFLLIRIYFKYKAEKGSFKEGKKDPNFGLTFL